MDTIKRGLAPVREATTLQVFLLALGYPLNPDGNFGQGTETALRQFQQDHGLIVDGVAGEKTWTTLFALKPELLSQISARWLSQQDIEAFAVKFSLSVPLVRTVYSVESGGMGFVGVKPKILFEGHVFWAELEKAGIDPRQHVVGNEDILFPNWNPKSYVGGLAEHARLDRAKKIAEGPALSAASWGLFQILGLHARPLKYASVQDFVEQMEEKEANHLDAFGRFISVNKFKGTPLVDLLRAQNWAAFARAYNGPAYEKNAYDKKLADAFAKHSAATLGV
ncbi:N-acetylmuramidase domain-containing protein [Roseateles chitinivorans]|uniref:N-acetylmuramidase domain-containing protein n=1 Tax=Roseateles chitinivorans TaxID=2917965 RepID=UPI003D66A39D